MQKLKSRHRPHIFAKINSKMDHRPKFKMQNYETPMIKKTMKNYDNIGENPDDLGCDAFLGTKDMIHERNNC